MRAPAKRAQDHRGDSSVFFPLHAFILARQYRSRICSRDYVLKQMEKQLSPSECRSCFRCRGHELVKMEWLKSHYSAGCNCSLGHSSDLRAQPLCTLLYNICMCSIDACLRCVHHMRARQRAKALRALCRPMYGIGRLHRCCI